jgi:hypothetical protein
MAGSTIDHMVALTVFLGALLLFIGLFNQTIQTAVLYQNHRYIASKCMDLLDNVLLSPGYPTSWGTSNSAPTSFGLQDPEFTQYRLSPFSLMRLNSLTGDPVYYPKTGKTYSNITMGFGNFLMVPYNQVVNYSTASRLLGTNGSYGFQLSVIPIVAVSISEFKTSNPLILAINVTGRGFPLSNAILSYCFLTVEVKGGEESFPSYTTAYGNAYTDDEGKAFLQFDEVTRDTTSYAVIVYAHLSGLTGLGYYQRLLDKKQFIIPFIDDFEERRVLVAHSYDVHYFGPPSAALFYNATFVLLTEDFTLREMPIENSTGKVGKVVYGEGWPYGVLTIPTANPGILIVTYRKGNEAGIVMMPWGISSMAFIVTFGENVSGREWVATDIREVIVNNVAYQAKLALWSLKGYQVTG